MIYAIVSTPKQRADLTRQIETLENFVLAQGIKVDQVFSVVSLSGLDEFYRDQKTNIQVEEVHQ